MYEFRPVIYENSDHGIPSSWDVFVYEVFIASFVNMGDAAQYCVWLSTCRNDVMERSAKPEET